ncbi:MAG: zinc ribbon domain-containing protein [bacterium]
MTETNIPTISRCKVTYFMGKLLAKAGTLSLNSEGLTFIPTALDRAIGAIDIPIPLEDIQAFYFNDTFQKTLQIKTPSQTHKFIGSAVNEIHDNLIVLKRQTSPHTLQKKEAEKASSAPPVPPVSLYCFTCKKPSKDTYKFCPYCKTQLKNLCPNCKEEINEGWAACAYCNSDLKKA